MGGTPTWPTAAAVQSFTALTSAWREGFLLVRGALLGLGVTALELLEALERVLQYSRLQRYCSDSERIRFVASLMSLGEVVDLPESIPRICRDPDDDRVIACAVAGNADVIVSGDRDLSALERVRRLSIQSATHFLEILEQGV